MTWFDLPAQEFEISEMATAAWATAVEAATPLAQAAGEGLEVLKQRAIQEGPPALAAMQENIKTTVDTYTPILHEAATSAFEQATPLASAAAESLAVQTEQLKQRALEEGPPALAALQQNARRGWLDAQAWAAAMLRDGL